MTRSGHFDALHLGQFPLFFKIWKLNFVPLEVLYSQSSRWPRRDELDVAKNSSKVGGLLEMKPRLPWWISISQTRHRPTFLPMLEITNFYSERVVDRIERHSAELLAPKSRGQTDEIHRLATFFLVHEEMEWDAVRHAFDSGEMNQVLSAASHRLATCIHRLFKWDVDRLAQFLLNFYLNSNDLS